jgi:hypothetical protein
MSKFCFVVMPFRPELNFFYLFIDRYLSEKHGIHVERGDHSILTKPLIEKIREQILAADVILADVSGGNPNVFYEVGLAQAFGKPVIFLTQDDPEKTPVDVRQFEFIQYDLSNHTDFLAKLDNAIQHVFEGKYREFHQKAIAALKEFSHFTGVPYDAASLGEFQARVMRAERQEVLPDLPTDQEILEFLLPKIFADVTDLRTMQQISEWLNQKFPREP